MAPEIFGIFITLVSILIAVGIAWGSLKTSVDNIKETLDKLDKDIKDDLNSLKSKVGKLSERFSVVEDRVETLWKDRIAPASSPRQLNEQGKDILLNSGIKEIIEEKKQQLLALVKEKSPSTPYDAEQVVLDIVASIPELDPSSLDKLKDGAFRVGQSVDLVLYVGGVYLRNLIFEDLGFSITDLDSQSK